MVGKLMGTTLDLQKMVPFDFKGRDVRVAKDEFGEPWFVLTDVCRALDLTNARMVAQRLDSDELRKLDLRSQSGQCHAVNESGLYSVILRSEKPQAKAFRKWVTSEVLPSIRKQGGYGLPIVNFSDARQVAALLAQSLEKVQEQSHQIINDRPKVLFHDQVVATNDTMSLSYVAKLVGMGRTRLLEILRKEKWVNSQNEPYQRKIESGHLSVKLSTYRHPYNGLTKRITTRVTGKGLVVIQELCSTIYNGK